MKKKLYAGLLAVSTLGSLSTVQAFNNGDVINFKPGAYACLLGGVYPACQYDVTTVSGSYFSLDTNGDGLFKVDERMPITPSIIAGLTVGVLQPAPATASHLGCPDGSENALVDEAWCFFGNTGAHQTTGTPVTDNGDGTLDFSGWGVTWNGIANIPMGLDNSLATLTCSSTPCTVNDVYEINFESMVPLGDPSMFGGVGYKLHLESNGPALPSASVNITIDGGTIQECSSEGGSNIQMSATTTVPTDDQVALIEWIVDGVNVASGTDVNAFIALGAHTVTASVTTVNGLVGIQDVLINVRDTTSPVVTAAFLDKETGLPVTQAANTEKVNIQAQASDICDASPAVTATLGMPVQDGQRIKVDAESGGVKLNASSLELNVTAIDASGNGVVGQETLSIIQ